MNKLQFSQKRNNELIRNWHSARSSVRSRTTSNAKHTPDYAEGFEARSEEK